MDHDIVRKHLPQEWTPEALIDGAVTAELLQAAVDDGVAEVKHRSGSVEVRLAPHHHEVPPGPASVCLSAMEKEALRAHAKAQGLSVSETIRLALEACGII